MKVVEPPPGFVFTDRPTVGDGHPAEEFLGIGENGHMELFFDDASGVLWLAFDHSERDRARAQREELASFLREAATADEHIHGTEWCQGIRALLAAQEKAGR